MPTRPIAAGYSILSLIVSGTVLIYFGYMASKISGSLSRIATALEQIRVDKAGQG